jgi:hypothetical protein
MNSSLIFVLLLVAILACANIFRTWIKQRKPDPENRELEDTLSKIEHLEDRIRVLERIITENRFDLKREIDSL